MGIAAVDMSEKNNKSNSPADNTKSEKKMTKYDLKMQRRQEEEKKAKKEKAIIKTGCILAVIICVCIAAWKFYDNYQESMAHILQLAIMKFRKLNLTIIITAV